MAMPGLSTPPFPGRVAGRVSGRRGRFRSRKSPISPGVGRPVIPGRGTPGRVEPINPFSGRPVPGRPVPGRPPPSPGRIGSVVGRSPPPGRVCVKSKLGRLLALPPSKPGKVGRVLGRVAPLAGRPEGRFVKSGRDSPGAPPVSGRLNPGRVAGRVKEPAGGLAGRVVGFMPPDGKLICGRELGEGRSKLGRLEPPLGKLGRLPPRLGVLGRAIEPPPPILGLPPPPPPARPPPARPPPPPVKPPRASSSAGWFQMLISSPQATNSLTILTICRFIFISLA